MSTQGKWFGYYEGQWFGPLDEPPAGVDIRAGWFQFNPTSASVCMAWGQFNTSAIDVRMSWAAAWSVVGIPERQVYYGGGKPNKETNEDRTRLFREHHDYLDALKLRVTNDDGSTIDTEIPRNMPLPDSVAGRAMRGKVGELERPQTAADILDDPISLAMLAVLVVEATED